MTRAGRLGPWPVLLLFASGCPDLGPDRVDWSQYDQPAVPDAEVPRDGGDGGEDVPLHADVRNVYLRFDPSEVTIAVGGTVTWHNEDPVPHGIQSGSPEAPTLLFMSSWIAPGDTFTVLFDEAGRFEYHGYSHPEFERDAFVEVVAGAR